MLVKDIRFGYLVSCDEIMFLGFEIEEKEMHGEYLFSEPWLYFSTPIKHTDTFDRTKGTISVRQGLLYIIISAMDILEKQTGIIIEDTLDSLNYAELTSPGKHWKPKGRAPRVSEESDDQTAA